MTLNAINSNENFIDTLHDTSGDTNILTRVGHIVRALHDSMSALGLSQILEQAAKDIPDTRDRLKYIATMTEQAAERVLNATDKAMPIQDELTETTKLITQKWHTTLDHAALKSEYNSVAEETIQHLQRVDQVSNETKAILIEIMMAQDFQDLTGQVIKKITQLMNDMESQLMQVLVDFSEVKSTHVVHTDVNPIVTDNSLTEAHINQSEVDGLLESLGF